MSKPQKIGEKYEQIVKERLEAQGYDVLRFKDKGVPDLLVLKDGKIVKFVEVKGGSHSVHGHQKKYHEMLKQLGFEVEVVKEPS